MPAGPLVMARTWRGAASWGRRYAAPRTVSRSAQVGSQGAGTQAGSAAARSFTAARMGSATRVRRVRQCR